MFLILCFHCLRHRLQAGVVVACLVVDGEADGAVVLGCELLPEHLLALKDDRTCGVEQSAGRLLQFATEFSVALEAYVIGVFNIWVFVGNHGIDVVAGMDFHLYYEGLLIAFRLYGGCKLHWIVGGSGFLHLSHCGNVGLVVFQHRIVVAGSRRVLRVNQPKPSAALGEEELLLVFFVPCPPFLRVVVAQKGVAVEQSASLFNVLSFLPKTDGTVEDALVVVGDAKALCVLIELEVVTVKGAVEIRSGIFELFLVGGNVGAKLREQLSCLLLNELPVGRNWLRVFRHHEVLPVKVGKFLACRLLVLY